MIQFNTLIYLFMAIFRLELNEQNVNLLVKRAAFFLHNPNDTINPSLVHVKFNACFDSVLVTNE